MVSGCVNGCTKPNTGCVVWCVVGVYLFVMNKCIKTPNIGKGNHNVSFENIDLSYSKTDCPFGQSWFRLLNRYY